MKISYALARFLKHARLKAVTGSTLHAQARIGAASQAIHWHPYFTRYILIEALE